MPDKDHRAELKRLADLFRDPLRMRVAACGVTLAVAFFGIYRPLDGQIRSASRKLQETEHHAAAAREVEFLRAQVAMFQPRLAPSPDANESVQYLLDGIRKLPVKLVQLDSESTIAVGPYEAVVLKVEARGDVRHLDQLLGWLETDKRLFRIDSVDLSPARGRDEQPALRLTLLALKVRS